MIKVVCDFETCNPFVDLRAVGSWVYAQDFSTEILCFNFAWKGYQSRWIPGCTAPDRILRDLVLNPEAIFFCHGTFEIDIWREHMVKVYGFPPLPFRRWRDIQASCAYKAVPQALEKALPAFDPTRAKDKVGSKLTISLSKTDKRKGPRGKPNPNYGKLTLRTPEIMERVYSYCDQDVADETWLLERVGELPEEETENELEVWFLDQTINERGVALDREFIRGARSVVDRARDPLMAEFRELTGGLEPTQRDKVLAWVHAHGIALPNLQKATIAELLGKEYVDLLLPDDEDDEDEIDETAAFWRVGAVPGNVRRALTIRTLVGSSSVRKVDRMEGCIANDGRAHRLSQYHGTSPGRWAGRLFNPLNFPRGLARVTPNGKAPDPELIVNLIKTGDPDAVDLLGCVLEEAGKWRPANPIEVVASALRHGIVAAPGHKFVVGDFAGIQMRLVLALAGEKEKCKLLAEGKDVYLDMAEDIYGVPKGSLDKVKDVEKRQVGKNTVLGCGFAMGAKKFHEKYCPDQPYDFAVKIIQAYRSIWAPGVPKLWDALDETSNRAMYLKGTPQTAEPYGITYEVEENWMSCRLLDGKKIWYFNPERIMERVIVEKPAGSEKWVLASRDPMPFDPDKLSPKYRTIADRTSAEGVRYERAEKINMRWQYDAIKTGRRVTVRAHGGHLAENVIMGLERQILVRAMLRCEREGFPVIMNSYDEIVCEVEESRAKWETLRGFMEDKSELPWADRIGVPIAAEGWVGPVYKKA